jgi:hypothetical protein
VLTDLGSLDLSEPFLRIREAHQSCLSPTRRRGPSLARRAQSMFFPCPCRQWKCRCVRRSC